MYNSHELARARAILTSEMNRDVFRVLQKRLDSYAKSDSQFPDNMWEGPNGEMEHIKSSFPMPQKVQEQDSNLASISPSQNTLDSSNDVITRTSHSELSPSTSTQLQTSGNSDVIHVSDEDASTSDIEILPSKALTDSGVIIDISDNVSSDVESDSSEEDVENKTNSKVSDLEKTNSPKSNSSLAKQHNTKTTNDKTVNNESISITSILNASVSEKKHWTRLSGLQKKITNAQSELRDLKFRLKKNKGERECKELDTVHWNIHGFITSLTEEKKCRDMNKFRNLKGKNLSKLNNSQSLSILPHSYSGTWNTLKNLCISFNVALKSNKNILAEFGVLQDVPGSNLLVRIKKIRFEN